MFKIGDMVQTNDKAVNFIIKKAKIINIKPARIPLITIQTQSETFKELNSMYFEKWDNKHPTENYCQISRQEIRSDKNLDVTLLMNEPIKLHLNIKPIWSTALGMPLEFVVNGE